MPTRPFVFKQFTVHQEKGAMKVGTDSILMGVWADVKSAARALDIGTGTGVIALMLAQRSASLVVDGVEIDPAAAGEAADNIAASPWSERIHIVSHAIQTFASRSAASYDLIVSNPPFFIANQSVPSPHRPRQLARQTDTLSLADLCACVAKLLTPHGRFCVILPTAVGQTFRVLALSHQLHCTRLTHVQPLPHKPPHRMLMQFEFQARPLQTDELIIEYEHHHYTEAYRELTHAFYLHMAVP